MYIINNSHINLEQYNKNDTQEFIMIVFPWRQILRKRKDLLGHLVSFFTKLSDKYFSPFSL